MIEIAGDKDAIATLNLQEIKSFLFNNYVSYKSHSPLAYKKVFINFNYDDQIHQLSPNDEILVYELQERVQVQPNFNLYSLPNKSFYSLYEQLYYRGDLKRLLLDFVESVSLFSSKGISKVSVNKLVLLHGPPVHYFNIGNTVLVEIKTNSLLNEVESLTAARKTAVCGLEPSDAIRVVNTILTQIDKLQTQSNVLVIATSNITEAIDEAFLDRADLALRIDNPSSEAIYQILYDGLRELHDKKLIMDMVCNCDELWDISKELERKNTSARKVGKLLLMAHARRIKKPQALYKEYLNAISESD
ncbi:Pachytene checkpoint protein 2 [Boothiomyces sp. JEL0838]|nr:Pachytene checkpoint protein 2 [Boothiomyces sp. JEL0838]